MTDQPAPSTEQTTPYRVLARKYRPGAFAELIGQEATVRTLANAFAKGRLAHAFILTGVRGVGKTTTARLIARALNCTGPRGAGEVAFEPCGECDNCMAVAESRSMDVLEMDAASRTGVDDIREIIESVQYAPIASRYKIYIIDEVHMLSRNAFNALLKTLEEPPPHVKFIFATTEIHKVPVTVLSRCQRFDLRRVDTAVLTRHLMQIAEKEAVSGTEAAFALLAHAAEGSVRDGLSLLDQAIAHGDGAITEDSIRDMLGLADRSRSLALLDHVFSGEMKSALEILREQYDLGVDPVLLIHNLLELVHWLTRHKVAPVVDDQVYSEAIRAHGTQMAAQLSMASLTRAWQMLLKGLQETQTAPAPLIAAEMTLIRLAFAADLPSPADLARTISQDQNTSAEPTTPEPKPDPPAPVSRQDTATPVSGTPPALEEITATPPSPPAPSTPSRATESLNPKTPLALKRAALPDAAPAPQEDAPPRPVPQNFQEVLELFEEKREALATHLKDSVHLVKFGHGQLEIRPEPEAPPDLAAKLGHYLSQWTGMRWVVSVSGEPGEPTLLQREHAAEAALTERIMQNETVQAVFEAFPGARISNIKQRADAPGEPAPRSGLDEPTE